ncbi:hypothetical protein GOP47_0025921 [Adiantum capillus-veneris]|uniref:Uncharacterized protein n=1 Tax=Adiantum capillus-veneris TaxID=13818 RepID=A0A9D4Z401_ADICA|nr:hypothetical protein GOP47_0025921 [Adiantum capillus-veneris]
MSLCARCDLISDQASFPSSSRSQRRYPGYPDLWTQSSYHFLQVVTRSTISANQEFRVRSWYLNSQRLQYSSRMHF